MTRDERAREAAHWFVRLQAGDGGPVDLSRWNDWSRDAANQRAFDEIARVSRLAPQLKGRLSKPQSSYAQRAALHFLQKKWLAAAALVLTVAASIAYWGGQHWGSVRGDPYETSIAEHRTVHFPDGSSAVLGGRTSVAVEFTPQARRITLQRGEALFTVAADPRRPFTVFAGKGSITALGTIFNVHRDEDRVVVKVAEGRVRVTRIAGGSVDRAVATLRGGEEVVLSKDGEPARIARIEPQQAAVWRDGRLQYRNAELKSVAADVNRYSGRRIALADAAVESLLYTGTVYQDRIDEWLQGLADLYPVEIRQTDATHLRIQWRNPVP